jgi:hypothetical protein
VRRGSGKTAIRAVSFFGPGKLAAEELAIGLDALGGFSEKAGEGGDGEENRGGLPTLAQSGDPDGGAGTVDGG